MSKFDLRRCFDQFWFDIERLQVHVGDDPEEMNLDGIQHAIMRMNLALKRAFELEEK